MTNRFIDSFAHYATADIPRKWSAYTAGAAAIDAAAARLASTGLLLTSSGSVTKTFDSQQIWTVGTAFRLPATYPAAQTSLIVLLDSGTIQCYASIDNLGRVSFVRGPATTLATTASAHITVGVYYYIELKVTIDNTVGTYEIKVNGISVLSGSGADTQATANASANQVQLTAAAATNHFSDFYANDGTGSAPNNTFWGDTRIQPTLPSGAGTTTQWTPSAGSNFQNVDDATPDGDTTYNSSNTLNQVDTYAYSNLSASTGTVYAVQSMPYARKDDAGPRSIAPVVRHSGTDYVGTTQPLSTSYQYHMQTYEQNPGTSAAWTIADVNAAEFGVKLIV